MHKGIVQWYNLFWQKLFFKTFFIFWVVLYDKLNLICQTLDLTDAKLHVSFIFLPIFKISTFQSCMLKYVGLPYLIFEFKFTFYLFIIIIIIFYIMFFKKKTVIPFNRVKHVWIIPGERKINSTATVRYYFKKSLCIHACKSSHPFASHGYFDNNTLII